MLLPKYSIKNHQFTIVVFALLTIFGVTRYFGMPRMENPSIYIPGGAIAIIYPGASPEDLEQLIAIPVEEAVNELDDIERINTTIIDGVVSVAVEFSYDTDPDEKFDEMVSKVNSIRNTLPEEIYDIRMSKWTSTDVHILQLALYTYNADYFLLKQFAEKLEKRLEKQYGVRKVNISGLPERQVHVRLNLEKMAALNITADQVGNAIVSNNTNIPAGDIYLGDKVLAVKSSGTYQSLQEIGETVVASQQGKLIYLHQMAEIDFDHEEQRYKTRYNGKPALFVSVQQKENLNIFDIMQGLELEIKRFEAELPNQVSLAVVFNQSEIVDERINGFMNNLLQGILLVGIVVFLALGLRSSIIVILAIPLSVVIGLGFVDLGNHGLQQISIAGLVVALGLLVDNSIVVVENINRFIKMGYKPHKAAYKGASQVGWPVASATLTTLLAFIPIILMPDEAGDFIKSMPITIIATLSASLFIALSLTPLIASRSFKKSPKSEKRSRFTKFMAEIIEGPYRNSLAKAINKPWQIIIISISAIIVCLLIFKLYVGISFFPTAEQPQFMLRITLPNGSNLKETEKVANYAESVLDTLSGVKHYATNIGHGNPRIYYNTFPKSYNSNFAELFVQLEDYHPEQFYLQLESLRKHLEGYPGAKFALKEFEQGTPINAPIEVYLIGNNMELLKQYADSIESFIQSQPGVINLENHIDQNQLNLKFEVMKDKALSLGVPVINIDKMVRLAINGLSVSKYRDDKGEEYDIVLNMARSQEDVVIDDLGKIYFHSAAGHFIPFKHLVNVVPETSQGMIMRYNLERYASVTSDLDKSYTLDEVLNPVMDKIAGMNLPEELEVVYMGEFESRQDTFGGLGNAIVYAIIAIFAVLVLQFRSFVQPLIIFSAFPLAVAGSILALFITGNSFSFTAFIGFISLAGIVINNSIILVDYTNSLIRDEGKGINEALQEAGETRFTPIILTTLTTIGGLLPLTLQGGSMWAPMGWTIIGGLAVSAFLTLLVVPALYRLIVKT